MRAGMHVSLVTLRSARARCNGSAYRRRPPAAYDDECRPYCRRERERGKRNGWATVIKERCEREEEGEGAMN